MIQIEHNIVKNPNWSEANQLPIYKRGRGSELGATVKQIQIVVRAQHPDFKSGANSSATLSPFLALTVHKTLLLKVAQNSFNPYIWIGRYNHCLSFDATILVSKNCPIIAEHVVIIFLKQ